MAVILTKLLIIKSVSEIQCLIHWFFLLFYVGSSRLRAAVCWNQYLLWVKSDFTWQPPSGGCVLKLFSTITRDCCKSQPPSGGCVLKHIKQVFINSPRKQPPSGGCVLKHINPSTFSFFNSAAAFGRLCVETSNSVDLPAPYESSRLRAAVCWNYA